MIFDFYIKVGLVSINSTSQVLSLFFVWAGWRYWGDSIIMWSHKMILIN